MDYEITADGQIASLTLNRPSVYNALNADCLGAMVEFADLLEGDRDLRVGIITGRGGAFCVGADIGEFRCSLNEATRSQEEPDFLDHVYRAFQRFRAVKKPLVAAVNGSAVGGGLELVLCCDVVVAAETAEFGDGHANYGIIPGGGATVLLPRVLPFNVANYLLLTGEMLPARDMQMHGLVNVVTPRDAVRERAMEIAHGIAVKSPLASIEVKRLAKLALVRSVDDAIRDEFLALRRHVRSHDLREGLSAFIEKRRPVFCGS